MSAAFMPTGVAVCADEDEHVTAGFRRHLREARDAVALTDGRSSLTRSRLAGLGDAVRGHARLRDAARIAVVGTQSLRLAAVLAACHLAGREFAVVDAGEDPAVLGAHLEALHPDAVVAVSEPDFACGKPVVRAEDLFAAAAPSTEDSRPAAPYAYTVRTSGTTGRPKLVQLSRPALGQYVAEFTAHYAVGAGSRIAVWAAPTYDAHHSQLFSALAAGAVGVVAEPAVRRSGDSVLDWLTTHRITHFETTPSILRGLVAAAATRGLPPDLVHLMCSGERFDPGLARAVAALGGGLRLSNEYGPTECVLATWHELTPADLDLPDLPVGTAIPGREVNVCPPPGAAAASPGDPGEIVIRSPHLCAGYGLDGALAEAFPVGEDGVRTYRTGDFGYFDERGLLRLTGRRDRTIKRRGVKIDLDDVERAVRSVPAVTDAAARAENDGTAVWVWAVARGRTAEDLRADVMPLLAAASAPERIVLVDALPRLHSGKVDYAGLPRPAAATAGDAAGDAAAATGTEADVAAEFARVLGVPEAAPDADFFALGGHSLLALDLNQSLGRRFGVAVTLADVLRHPQVRALAALIDRKRAERPATGPADRPTGLTAAERPLWSWSQLFPADGSANVVAGFRTTLPIGGTEVAEAAGRLVRTTAQLRLGYPAAGRPERVVHPPRPVDVRTVTVTGDPGDGTRPEVRRELYRPFDIARDQLVRVVLVRSGTGTAVFLVVHHIVCDGIGLATLLADLHRLLAGGDAGPGAPAPAVIAGPPAPAAGQYWQSVKDRLRTIPCTLAPEPGAVAGPEPFAVPKSTVDAALSGEDLRLSVVLVEYVAEALLRVTASDAVVVEVPVSLRTPEQARAVGNFVVDVPVVVDRSTPDGRAGRRRRLAADLLDAVDAAAAAPGFGGLRPGQGLAPPGDAVVVLDHPPATTVPGLVPVPGSPPRNPVAVYVTAAADVLEFRVLGRGGPDLARTIATHLRTVTAGPAGPPVRQEHQ
ncbi:AMP-binding protein [Amycolatopsis sp. NPDC004625]|uniref:AMP-binding protein n=1 Tax=Amycolatopsis sp. NPDC004625 TaxID=3154670 RepID=UPI00339FA80C